ncbi:hypothetical protein [Ohtaekwangia koreensis]|uniref:Uncharacterized protein n=1 Tax=Ohtaekwangia koreensis TaxID=688867 RepID=A0A1T5MNJ2_9BACT|nr:hypothetical protein [Ohtaekwangia koreensis]SKC89752.1 hypothetical protein SAMN05660236_5925 [Ohtaekwangia koreensis]
MNRIVVTLSITLLYCVNVLAQDGSDIVYCKINKLKSSDIGKEALLDFYRRSFRGIYIDTVTINIQNKPVKLIEHREDNGFNNWFNMQYLESVELIDGMRIKVTKSKITAITSDSIQVDNYIQYYSASNTLIESRSSIEPYRFKKRMINEILIHLE